MAIRYDRAPLTSPITGDKTGFIRTDAVFTRVGVFPYMNPDGTMRYEFRPPEEVFSAATLDSMRLLPVYDDHPPDIITKENVSEFNPVGSTGDTPSAKSDNVVGPIVVWDAAMIASIGKGKRDLSMGYTTDVTDESGVWRGIPYTHTQRYIVYNHVAVVDQGRAGNARLRVDRGEESTDLVTKEAYQMNIFDLLRIMGISVESRGDSKVAVINGKRVDIGTTDAEHKAVLEAVAAAARAPAPKTDAKTDDMSVQMADLRVEAARKDAKIDALTEKLEKLSEGKGDKDKADDKARFDSAVRERVELMGYAKALKIDNADKLDSKELRVAILVADHSDSPKKQEEFKKSLEKKADAYIEARFDAFKEDYSAEDEADSSEEARALSTPSNPRKDTDDDEEEGSADPAAARTDMIDRLRARHKLATTKK